MKCGIKFFLVFCSAFMCITGCSNYGNSSNKTSRTNSYFESEEESFNSNVPSDTFLFEPEPVRIWFVNYDGTVLEETSVEYNSTPVYSGSIPTRETDEEYIYSFSGWEPSIGPAIESTKYVAQYDRTTNHLNYSDNGIIFDKGFFVQNTHTFNGEQGGCFYNDHLFRFETNNKFKVYSFSKKKLLGTYILNPDLQDSSLFPHCNSACFGKEFYSKDDMFPLVYVNAYSKGKLPNGALYAFRITKKNNLFTSSLVQTIRIGFADAIDWAGESPRCPEGNFVIDVSNSKLYAYVPRSDIAQTNFFVFKLPLISDGKDIVLNKNDLIDSFTTKHILFPQDNCLYNNKIYLCSGRSEHGHITVLDLSTKKFVIDIDLNANYMNWEPEFIDIIDNYLYCGCGRLLKFVFLKYI